MPEVKAKLKPTLAQQVVAQAVPMGEADEMYMTTQFYQICCRGFAVDKDENPSFEFPSPCALVIPWDVPSVITKIGKYLASHVVQISCAITDQIRQDE